MPYTNRTPPVQCLRLSGQVPLDRVHERFDLVRGERVLVGLGHHVTAIGEGEQVGPLLRVGYPLGRLRTSAIIVRSSIGTGSSASGSKKTGSCGPISLPNLVRNNSCC
jgi:hypothetical protein